MEVNVVYGFDDGFLDGIAWMSCFARPPVCGKATFFVSPGLVGNNYSPLYTIGNYDKDFRMTWEHLKKIVACGGEIGCHGWMHERYDQIDKTAALTFLRHCDDEFGRWIGKRPACFAFADHKVGHLDLVKQFYKYVRPIPSVPNAMFLNQDETYLFVWHKATDPDDLYGTTQVLIGKQATFLTFGEACQKQLLPHL